MRKTQKKKNLTGGLDPSPSLGCIADARTGVEGRQKKEGA